MFRKNEPCKKKSKRISTSFNWKIREHRKKFLRTLYELVSNWKVELPNFKNVFCKQDMDKILVLIVKYGYDLNLLHLSGLIDFIVRTNYKDVPEVDENGRPLSRCTTALHYIAKQGLAIDVSRFFKIYDRFDVNYTDESGFTHFHVACKLGCYKVAKKFLKLGQDPDCLWLETGDSPLHLVMSKLNPKLIKLLLRKGANPNLANKNGATPLHVTCQVYSGEEKMKTFFKICDEENLTVEVNARDKLSNTPLLLALMGKQNINPELLLRRGADPNLANEDGMTPLHVISKIYSIDSDLMEMFFKINDELKQTLQVDARDNVGNTPLHLALMKDNDGNVAVLLRRGADPNLADYNGATPLHIICRKYLGELDMKKFFKVCDEENLTVEVNARDKLSNTPLLLAVMEKKKKVVEILLRRGANPNLFNEDGATPLHVICQNYYGDEMMKIFFTVCDEENRIVEVNARDKLGNTPLLLALMRNREGMTELLLRRGANPNLANEDGTLPLHVLCRLGTDFKMLEKFFQVCDEKHRYVEIDARDKLGNTMLHLTVLTYQERLTELFLRRGADPNLANDNGMTPLHIICKETSISSYQIRGTLDEPGKIVTHDKFYNLALYTAEIFFQICDEMHRSVEVDARDKFGKTPLHSALNRPGKKLAELLLRRGANPNLVNEDGMTPVQVICKTYERDTWIKTFFEIIDEVQQTVQVDVRDSSGRTPLDWAVKYLLPDSVDALVERGADLSSFVFPLKAFQINIQQLREERRYSKLELTCDLLAVIESLEKGEYELEISLATKIMMFCAMYGSFEAAFNLEKSLFDDKQFVSKAKRMKIGSSRTLDYFARLPPDYVEARLTCIDFSRFLRMYDISITPEGPIRTCTRYLFAILVRKFCRKCALECLLLLTRLRLPVLCCDMILGNLTNGDLRRVCLAVVRQSS